MPSRLLRCAALAAGLWVATAAAPAGADETAAWKGLASAREALARNDRATAREQMFDRVLAEDATDEELLHIARLGYDLGDRDVLQELRVVLEDRNAKGSSPTRTLAVGWAYLSLARTYIQSQSNSTSVPMLFDDAGKIARQLLDSVKTTGLRSGARLLAARLEEIQGRRDAALTLLGAETDRAPVWAPAMNGLEGRWRYDRGASAALGADGRPTKDALRDLTLGHDLMDKALASPSDIGTNKEGIESLIARRAWASHRLGDQGAARREYGALYDRGSLGRSLAIRGLASLFAHDAEQHEATLASLAKSRGSDDGGDAWAALIATRVKRNALGPALLAAQGFLEAKESARAWLMHGVVLRRMRAWTEAENSYVRALELDPTLTAASYELETMARGLLRTNPARAIAMYERLLPLRPDDPYIRNNLGFVLRDLVSPFTTMSPGNLQRLKPDAPEHALAWLKRSVSAYAEAVALIPEEDDGLREVLDDWNLAGIVNDYALMLHYFIDVQDGPRAESLYFRALRMTDGGFKDTYAPNLQRLYSFVLKGRELQWWRLAAQAQDAIMKEQRDDKGGLELVPDDAKRASARNDRARLRTRLLKELGVSESDDSKKGPR